MIVYIEELGAPKDMIDWYAGLAVSLSALSSALISPVWGRFADRYGRKPMMVRASLAMTFTMGGLAFVHNVYWLLALRVLNGLLSGYACAWIGHFIFERNKPASFKQPVYSFISDWRMFADVLRGRLSLLDRKYDKISS